MTIFTLNYLPAVTVVIPWKLAEYMEKTMPKLTKRLIDSHPSVTVDSTVWDEGDGSVKGFGVRVFPSGVKSFCLVYRDPYGKQRRYTIGKHGRDLTVDQARKVARELSADILRGADPAGNKVSTRKALAVNQLLDEYLKSAKFAAKADATRSADRGRLERHLRPLLGNQIVETLTIEDVRRAFSAIRDGKTAVDVKTGPRGRAIVRGGEGAARMSIRLLRAIFSWGVKERLIKDNPAQGIELGQDGRREVMLAAEDYQRLFRVLDQFEKEHRIRPAVADCLRVLALTGARRNEIAGLRWSEVNIKRGVAVLQSHKTASKTGAKEITLPSAVQAIITRQPKGAPDDYVFQPVRGSGPLSLNKPWRAIRAAASLPSDMGIHGLRHALGTLMAIQGAEAPQIMAALGHTQISTTRRYINIADQAKAELMERHTAGITAMMNEQAPAPVVEFKRKG